MMDGRHPTDEEAPEDDSPGLDGDSESKPEQRMKFKITFLLADALAQAPSYVEEVEEVTELNYVVADEFTNDRAEVYSEGAKLIIERVE